MRRRSPAALLSALGILLLVLGLLGIVLGRLGETTWKPAAEHVATVQLKDAGPAVVIDPGILYAGGHRGTLTVTGPADVSIIPATPSDIEAYLGDAHHTRITGVPSWSTLKAQDVNPGGPEDLSGIAQADLWPQVDAAGAKTGKVDVAAFWKAENDPPQPYRAVLVVTDGKQAGATSVQITWPSEEKNEWAPVVLTIGVILAIAGLVLLALGILRRRRDPAPAFPAASSAAVPTSGSAEEAPDANALDAHADAAPVDPEHEPPTATADTSATEQSSATEPSTVTEAPARAHGRRRAIVVTEDADAIHHPTAIATPGSHAAPAADGPREDETDVLRPVPLEDDGPAAEDVASSLHHDESAVADQADAPEDHLAGDHLPHVESEPVDQWSQGPDATDGQPTDATEQPSGPTERPAEQDDQHEHPTEDER